VVTYNLQGMRPGTNWQVRLYFTVQYLQELDPDLVLLQEVNETLDGGGEDNQALTIAEELSEYFGTEYHVYFRQTHVAWEQFDEGIAILSRYPVLEEGASSLVQGVFPRKVVWNHVETPAGLLSIYCTHLSYLPEHDGIRLQQVQQIRDYMAEREGLYPSSGVLLGGDFNCTPDTAPIELLTDPPAGTIYRDVWNELHPGEPGYTVPADDPDSRIDYIFRGVVGGLESDSARVVMDEPYDASNFCSDHLGVLGVFSLWVNAQRGEVRSLLPVQAAINRPNPFNSSTTFVFWLERPALTRLELFGLDGRRVETLEAGLQPEGWRELRWDARDLPAGQYLYSLRTGGNLSFGKCLLLK